MTKLYLFFVFFVSAVSLMAGPNTYTLINDKTYTWLEAKADAESRGGYLATITTIDEENKLKKWKNDLGFIAQDVQKVVPELVRENENGMLSVRHQSITPILLEAIKELEARVKELENNCDCKK